ncbi:MAG TPA: hypothetical protein VES00_19945 [Burkholderiaceae bacterium]|nr:hypothetical protein [Burkholderiaceae bacterium]
MASLLAPTYALTVAQQQWTQQLVSLDARLEAAPGVGELIARLPTSAPLSAAPGDPVSLTLDGGEGGETVFTGVVASIRRTLDGIRIRAIDGLGQLARYRPATTFNQASAGTVIRSLADDAGAIAGDIADGVMLPFYAADPSRTAAEHAARVAGWSGALLSVDGDGALNAVVLDATQADLALRYGREVMAFAAEDLPDPDTVTVAGESGAGTGDSPDALRLSADPFAGNRPDGPSLGNAWFWEPALRTASDAATAGAARQRLLRAAQKGARLRAFLVPKLRPGVVVELADLPNGLPRGPYWLDRVRHSIGARGAITNARLHMGGDSFDPTSLLGSAAGALAGAL